MNFRITSNYLIRNAIIEITRLKSDLADFTKEPTEEEKLTLHYQIGLCNKYLKRGPMRIIIP